MNVERAIVSFVVHQPFSYTYASVFFFLVLAASPLVQFFEKLPHMIVKFKRAIKLHYNHTKLHDRRF